MLAARLLDEAGDPASPSSSATPHWRCGPDDGHRRQRALAAVEVEQRAEVDVGDAVGVGGAEALAAEPLRRAPRPARRSACRAPVSTHSTSHPVRPALAGGELLDRLAQVAGREQEALEPLGGVDLDHVPEDRPAADLDQRLRHRLGPLAQPRPAAAAEDDDGWLHRFRHCGGYSPPEVRSSAQPPATAGRIVTSSPSLIDRLQALLEADVLAADVDVDEAAQVAVLGDPLAQVAVGVEDGVEHLADGGALDLELGLAAGRGAQLGRDLHGDCHQTATSCARTRTRSCRGRGRSRASGTYRGSRRASSGPRR